MIRLDRTFRAPPMRARPKCRGVSAIETLLALPVVLLVGLSALQVGLVLHARQAVMHAATEAVRAGALDHAAAPAIERGFARGLSPWLYGAQDAAEHQVNVARTLGHLAHGRASGWVLSRQLSPTAESFRDWAVPAMDEAGRPMPDVLEIPIDNPVARARSTEPASGRRDSPVALRAGAPVGLASGQTLADANLLKVEFSYGVPLTVPLAGPLGAWILSVVDGCAAPSARRWALLAFGQPAPGVRRPWTCAFYAARAPDGRWQPRWPVRVASLTRLQSPARHAGDASPSSPLAAEGTPSAGRIDDRPAVPPGVHALNPGGVPAESDGSTRRGEGFLDLGGDGMRPEPGVCVMPG